jgi:2-dehydro-3-deoxyglucarate aldolase/4-hydroxy-2-oxoheptanedioate aldolase
MRTNTAKQALKRGEVSVGVMCMEFATPGIGRIQAEAGAQFAVYDMEHTGWSLETIKMLVATSRAVDISPIVRPPVGDYHHIAHVLDVGAMGLVIPLVNSAAQMQEIVRCAQYPPDGIRGCAFGLAHDDFRPGELRSQMQQANDQLLIVAQIETAAGLENVDEIAAVEGVDALWIGQFDLTTSLGIPGQFDHPLFVDATRRVLDACHRADKVAALAVSAPDELAAGPKRGFRMLVYTADLWIYQQALRSCFRQIREPSLR